MIGNCDICGRVNAYLVALRPEFVTEDISLICSSCKEKADKIVADTYKKTILGARKALIDLKEKTQKKGE